MTKSLSAGQRSQRSFKIHQQESSKRSGKTVLTHADAHRLVGKSPGFVFSTAIN